MPTDAKLTSDRDIEIDVTGDIATVEGDQNVEQQHVNAIYRAVEEFGRGSVLGANAREEIIVALREEFSDFPYAEQVIVEIEILDQREIEVTLDSSAVREPITEEVTV